MNSVPDIKAEIEKNMKLHLENAMKKKSLNTNKKVIDNKNTPEVML